LGIVGGKVSGKDGAGLEILDIESIAPIQEFYDLVEEAARGLLGRLPQTKTPSGGRHVFYRCETIEGNQKLAERAEEVAAADLPRTDDGTVDQAKAKEAGLREIDGKWFKVRTLIETRGEGGQVLSPLCLPGTHPSGGVYEPINGDLRDIPTITPAEREILLTAARACNEFVEPSKAKGARGAGRPVDGIKPGADYNGRSDAFDKTLALLERNGWTVWKKQSIGPLLSRPGVSDHCSARLFNDAIFHVFSSNASPFSINDTYSPFAVFTELEHNGDYGAAAKALGAEGYGDQAKASKKKTTGQSSTQSASKGGAQPDADDAEGLTLSQQIVKLARENAQLFHDAGGDAYLTAKVGDHVENYRLGSRDSKDWLVGLLYEKASRVVSTDKISEALTVLRAIARHDSIEIETHVRVAEHGRAIYLDLCDKEWRQTEITATGWRVIGSAESPVRFVRAKGMLAIPAPVRGGSLSELRDLLNLPEDDAENWPLILGWLVAALKPCNVEAFDYPLLAVHGEQGSGKSTAQRILRDLVDPNKATLRAAPRNEQDLVIAAAHGRVISCDNLTSISENLSNGLCRMSTGGGFATRELFTDDGEVIFDAQRPVVLNGISEVVTKSDLLDRALLTNLPVIPAARRWRKRILQRKFADARPRILGALLDAVSVGLERMADGFDMQEWPRMADFAEWVMACEKGLGLAEGAFIAAYRRNVGRANNLAIDASIVAQAIIKFVDEAEGNCFQGTVGELLQALNEKTEISLAPPKAKSDWPATPEKLRAELKKLAPNLRRERIEVVWGDRTRRGRQLTLGRQVRGQPSQPSHRHQTNEINNLECDGLRDGSLFSEKETVTQTATHSPQSPECDGSHGDGKADRHTDRHTLNHSKQRAGDGVTVVTVDNGPTDPTSKPLADILHEMNDPTHRRRVVL
jgi:energy-coupling factor transporter ATP-binding protein EcfA2